MELHPIIRNSSACDLVSIPPAFCALVDCMEPTFVHWSEVHIIMEDEINTSAFMLLDSSEVPSFNFNSVYLCQWYRTEHDL